MLTNNGDLRHAVSYVHSESRLWRQVLSVRQTEDVEVVESTCVTLQVAHNSRAASQDQSCARTLWCANAHKSV